MKYLFIISILVAIIITTCENLFNKSDEISEETQKEVKKSFGINDSLSAEYRKRGFSDYCDFKEQYTAVDREAGRLADKEFGEGFSEKRTKFFYKTLSKLEKKFFFEHGDLTFDLVQKDIAIFVRSEFDCKFNY
ncbi:MAG: hypothetical protein H7Y13_11760 [Sphingobacteriaceae bacterium]|nr:hypothetical protein [Sphingobacteriaceae bacterium]